MSVIVRNLSDGGIYHLRDDYELWRLQQFGRASVAAPAPALNLLILAYELGDLMKCWVRSSAHAGIPTLTEGYRAEARKACGDALTMLRVVTAGMGLSFWDCLALGEAAFEERMEQLRALDERSSTSGEEEHHADSVR